MPPRDRDLTLQSVLDISLDSIEGGGVEVDLEQEELGMSEVPDCKETGEDVRDTFNVCKETGEDVRGHTQCM